VLSPDIDILLDENRVILNKECQYFIKCNNSSWEKADSNKTDISGSPIKNSYDMYLPIGWKVQESMPFNDLSEQDTTISHKYRGARYGFSQETQYSDSLEKYIYSYYDRRENQNNQKIYGYSEIETISPVLFTNYISNTEFQSTSGWRGVAWGNSSNSGLPEEKCAEVSTIFAKLEDTSLIEGITTLTDGSVGTDGFKDYKPYLKCKFPKWSLTDY
jgi:hypothetical protein